MAFGKKSSCCREHWMKIALLAILILFISQYLATQYVYQKHPSEYIYLWYQSTKTWTNNSLVSFESSTVTVPRPKAILTPTTPAFRNVTYYMTNVTSSSSHHVSTSPPTLTQQAEELPNCPVVPPNLVGSLAVPFTSPTFNEMTDTFKDPQIALSGHWKPKHCKSRDKVAIIIPYRDREVQLRAFLWHMHPILRRQLIEYGIFVVEQANGTRFNRALLMNIGFVEAGKLFNWDCYIFHDVDLLPEDDRNLYTCPDEGQARHMSVAIDTMGYKLPYHDIFGGACAIRRDTMVTVNGFSNYFWGWGGEDDDMGNRIKKHNVKIVRYQTDIARYKMFRHEHEAGNKANPLRFKLLYQGWKRYDTDGLNSLKYELIEVIKTPLLTMVKVKVTEPTKLPVS